MPFRPLCGLRLYTKTERFATGPDEILSDIEQAIGLPGRIGLPIT